jgi:hypothetical protein
MADISRFYFARGGQMSGTVEERVRQSERDALVQVYAGDVVEALDARDRIITNLREGIARAANSILVADAHGQLDEAVVRKAFEWLRNEGRHLISLATR